MRFVQCFKVPTAQESARRVSVLRPRWSRPHLDVPRELHLPRRRADLPLRERARRSERARRIVELRRTSDRAFRAF